jgi:type IV pilus assembly protein PilE
MTGGRFYLEVIVKGYTLIELMVVVAIIGIISAIAYPSYQGYMRDTYRGQAAADLKVCALTLDRYYSNGFTYVGADTAGVCTLVSPSSGTTRYNLSFSSAPTATNYVILATPVGESCGSSNCIQLTADGTQTTL